MTGADDNDTKRAPCAQVDWSAPAPRSIFFDDIYFADDGLAESRHVFLDGNDLSDRFARARAEGRRFTIGETGFGAGLNFAAALALWRGASGPLTHLDYLTTEQFPLTPADFARGQAHWPDLGKTAARLRDLYAPVANGVHRFEIADDVTLTLIVGEAGEALTRTDARVDAWFLDGFAPSKNPEMWRPALFEQIARLSAPNARFATFTVAGAVRRNAEQAGFELARRPGFGRKREMLTGRLVRRSSNRTPARPPWFDAPPDAPPGAPPGAPAGMGARAAIIGGGVAGASLARALRRRGLAPTIFDPRGLAAGASGNPGGLIAPRLDLDAGPAARFFLGAYLHTLRTLNILQAEDAGWFRRCGVLKPAADDAERARQAKLLAQSPLPEAWIAAHADGLFFPHAGVVDPQAYVAALNGSTPLVAEDIVAVDGEPGDLRLRDAQGRRVGDGFDAVIIANARGALRFAACRTLPLKGVAGQLDWFPDAPSPRFAVAAGPYAAPAPSGGLLLGATYEPGDADETPRPSRAATQSNIDAAGALLTERPSIEAADSAPRVAVRCQTPDRLPIAGALPDWGYYGAHYDALRFGARRDYPPGRAAPGLFALTGLGSRGLVTAPLCAEIIAARLVGAPAPVEADVADALNPARFFIRALRRATIKR